MNSLTDVMIPHFPGHKWGMAYCRMAFALSRIALGSTQTLRSEFDTFPESLRRT
jgi:hypothetical protein